ALLGLPVAWARVYMGVHWPLDMAGAVLDAMLAALVCLALRRHVLPWLRQRIETPYRAVFAWTIRRGWLGASVCLRHSCRPLCSPGTSTGTLSPPSPLTNLPMPTPPVLSDRQTGWLSAVLAGLALWLTLRLNLLPALFAGLLIYELIRIGTPPITRWLTRNRDWAQWLLVTVLAIGLIGLLFWLVFGAISLLHNQLGNPQELWRKQLVPLFDRARAQMPSWIVDHLPASVEGMRQEVMRWIGRHAGTLGHAGKEAVVVF